MYIINPHSRSRCSVLKMVCYLVFSETAVGRQCLFHFFVQKMIEMVVKWNLMRLLF